MVGSPQAFFCNLPNFLEKSSGEGRNYKKPLSNRSAGVFRFISVIAELFEAPGPIQPKLPPLRLGSLFCQEQSEVPNFLLVFERQLCQDLFKGFHQDAIGFSTLKSSLMAPGHLRQRAYAPALIASCPARSASSSFSTFGPPPWARSGLPPPPPPSSFAAA